MNRFFHRHRRRVALGTLSLFILSLLLPGAAQARENYGSFMPKDAAYQTNWRPFNDGKFSEITSFSCVLPDGSDLNSAQQAAVSDIAQIGAKIFAGQLEAGDFKGGGIEYGDPKDAPDGFDNPYDTSFFRGLLDGVFVGVAGAIGSVGGPKGAIAGGLLGYAGGQALLGEYGNPQDAANKDYQNNKGPGKKYRNLGFKTGIEGLQQYLRQSKKALREGKWAISQESYVRPGFFTNFAEIRPDVARESGVPHFVIDTGHGNSRTMKPWRQKLLSEMINDRAKAPITAFNISQGGRGGDPGLPAGCALMPFSVIQGDAPGLKDILGDMRGAILDTMLWIPGKIINDFYNFISPLAFKFAFWTPHTERGDLFWTVADSCDSGTKTGSAIAIAADTCRGSTALGYSEKNLDVKKQAGEGTAGAIILKTSNFVKWLLSGTYFLILFAAAAVFIVRGNASGNFHLLRMLPWLLASVLFALLLPYIMGAVITFSNLLVSAFFGRAEYGSVARMGLMFTQTGALFGGDQFFQQVVNIIVGGFASYYLIILTVINLLRQIALIVAVIVAPVAAFSLIAPAWRSFFFRWVRAFLVIAFLPVVFTLILRIGMSLNPMVINPEAAYGTLGGILGILLMLLVLFILTKIARASKDFIVGQSSMATGALSGAGAGLTKLAGDRDSAGAGALRAVGGSLQAQSSNAQNQSGSMIPKGRAASAGVLTAGNALAAWKQVKADKGPMSAEDAAAEGRAPISAEEAHPLLAQQRVLGKEGMYNKHGYWIEKVGNHYYRNYNDPGDDRTAMPWPPEGSEQQQRWEQQQADVDDVYGAAGAEAVIPGTGAPVGVPEDFNYQQVLEEAARQRRSGPTPGGPRPANPNPPPPTSGTPPVPESGRRPSSPNMPTPTTGTPAVPESGGPRPAPTGPSTAGPSGGETVGDVPGIGPLDGQGPTV
jgi:hypothetical protein